METLYVAGMRDVVVLERRQLGAGASGKTGALVRCHYANPPEAATSARACSGVRVPTTRLPSR